MNAIFWNGGIRLGTFMRYIGPYKIAHWLRKHGYPSQVIDFASAATEDYLYKLTKKFITQDTRVIGISTTFIIDTYFDVAKENTWSDGTLRLLPEHMVKVAHRIKKEHPKIKFILGGYKSELVESFGIIDASIMSYTSASEDIMLEYLEHLTSGKPLPKGQLIFTTDTATGEKQHRMVYNIANNPRYNIELDDFKFTKQDCILPGEPLPLDVSRGCIFACRFCQYAHLGKGKLDYIRGMEYLEQEMLENYNNFGTTSYYILDDTFNDTEIKMKAFYEMTQRLPFKINYASYLRADLIDRFPDMAYYIKESGCFGAYHGIESFHPSASKIIGKAWSGKRGKEFLPHLYHDIWKDSVPMHNNFIVGITTDTKQNIDDTISWFKDNKMHSIWFHPLGVYGTDNSNSMFTVKSEFDKNPEKYGYTILGINDNKYTLWKNDNWTTDLAYRYTNKANSDAADFTKVHIWKNLALLWQGYTKEYLMTKNSNSIPWDDIFEILKQKQREYWKMILSL